MQANSTISAKRIEAIREILLATGWAEDHRGWLAPLHMREPIAAQYGNRAYPDECHLHLWDAINAQTRFDLWVMHEAEAA